MLTKRRLIWLAVAGLALAIGLWLGWPHLMGQSVATVLVERRDIIQTVVATGRVETPSRVEIGTPITGTIAGILATEGQSVKAGQALIRLEDGELRANVELANAGVRQAEARLRQLADLALPNARHALEQASANALNAGHQFERVKPLAARGFATPVQLDEARRALDVALSQVRIAELQVAAASPGGVDVVLAEAALAQSRASLSAVEAKLAYATIRAPADAIVMTRNIESGAVVQPGKALLVLSPLGDTRLVMQIDERNLALIATGQPALASADAYAKESFRAVLVFINPAVDPAKGSVEVKLAVPAPPAYLKEDMTVSVDIEVARREKTLVLPTNAVRDGLAAEPWVLAVVNGRTLRKPVKLGARGAALVEILDGLSEGDRVVPTKEVGTQSGQRVRASFP